MRKTCNKLGIFILLCCFSFVPWVIFALTLRIFLILQKGIHCKMTLFIQVERKLPEQKWGKSGSWAPLWRNHSCRGMCASGRWCSSGSWQSWHSAERSWAWQRDLRWTPPLRSWCCWTGEGSQCGWRDRLRRRRRHQRRPLHRCSGTLNPRLVVMGTTWLLNKTGGETNKESVFG